MPKINHLSLDRALSKINKALKTQFLLIDLLGLIHERQIDIAIQIDGYVAEILESPSYEPISDKSVRKFHRIQAAWMIPDDIHRESINSLIDGSCKEVAITSAFIKSHDKRKKKQLEHKDYVLFGDCDIEKCNDFFHDKVTMDANKGLVYKTSLFGSSKLLPLHISKLEQNGCTLGVNLTKNKLWITEASLKKFLKTAPTHNDKKIESLTKENEKLLKIIGVMNATIKAKKHHPKITQDDFIQFAKNNLIDDVQITGVMTHVFTAANKEIKKYIL
jgi:hypothetical protein